jgi:hypothetical protein
VLGCHDGGQDIFRQSSEKVANALSTAHSKGNGSQAMKEDGGWEGGRMDCGQAGSIRTAWLVLVTAKIPKRLY